jgi:hypothetical protein
MPVDLDVNDVDDDRDVEDDDRDVVAVSSPHDEAVVRYDSVVVMVSVIVCVLSDEMSEMLSETQLTGISNVTTPLVTPLQEHALAYCVVTQLAVAYAGEGPTSVVVLYVAAGVLNCRRILALGSSGSLGSMTVEVGSSISVENGSPSEDVSLKVSVPLRDDVERDEVLLG